MEAYATLLLPEVVLLQYYYSTRRYYAYFASRDDLDVRNLACARSLSSGVHTSRRIYLYSTVRAGAALCVCTAHALWGMSCLGTAQISLTRLSPAVWISALSRSESSATEYGRRSEKTERVGQRIFLNQKTTTNTHV